MKSIEEKKIRRVAVVGGGPAGWLAALYLQQHIGHQTEIVVVSPRDTPPMSVGESTNGPFTGFLEDVGISKEDVIRECKGTLKIASEFPNWNREAVGYDWVHEFQDTQLIHGLSLYHYWHARYLVDRAMRSYQESCFTNAQLVRAGRVPFASPTAVPTFRFGYHLDATSFAELLKKRALSSGARWVAGAVSGVQVNEGFIRKLVLDDNADLEADFYIDASGFRRRLIGSLQGDEPFVSWRGRARCDATVYTRIDEPAGAIRPSTRGTALSSGWCWDIPLAGAVSIGYVYSSTHLDAERAEGELRRTYGLSPEAELARMSWDPGMFRSPWKQNCVAIGVTASFFDPIESLTSATLTVELKQLLVNFPNRSLNASSRERYNDAIRAQHEANANFISLHYFSATRDDSDFWKSCKQSSWLSNETRRLLRSFEEQAPIDASGIYSLKGVVGLLSSRGLTPKDPYPLLAYTGDWARAEEVFAQVRKEQREVERQSMDHRAFLRAIAGVHQSR